MLLEPKPGRAPVTRAPAAARLEASATSSLPQTREPSQPHPVASSASPRACLATTPTLLSRLATPAAIRLEASATSSSPRTRETSRPRPLEGSASPRAHCYGRLRFASSRFDDAFLRFGSRGRVPVRLYVRNVQEDLEYIEDAVPVSDWEGVSYINRPFEIRKVEGRSYITLEHALQTLLPEFFSSKPVGALESAADSSDATNSSRSSQEAEQALASPQEAGAAKRSKVKLVRVQGIELDMDIPFLWVANNLKNPEYYLHICVYVGTRKQ